MTARPRIMLISALKQSPAPAAAAMAAVWPEAVCNNLIDDSLAKDLQAHGEDAPEIAERILALGRYAANVNGADGATVGVLFTCSAFGSAIRQVKAELSIPVVSPNEGAFEEALDICKSIKGGGRVGLLVSFDRSLDSLSEELLSMAATRGQPPPQVISAIADGALDALRAGDGQKHDQIIADAAAGMPPTDVFVIGQFSMARAAALVSQRRTEPVLTTPHSAARTLKRLVEGST